MASYTRSEVSEAKAHLRKILKPGDTVYTILRHVSRSGMQRRIDVYAIVENKPVYLSGWAAAALQWTRSKDGPVVASGCGMDMGFHLVHELSSALHPAVTDESVSYALRTKHVPFETDVPGYTLRHAWL